MNEVRFEIPHTSMLGRKKMVERTVRFPSTLDELTPAQFLRFFQLAEMDMDDMQRRILFLNFVSNLEKKYFLRLREGDILTLTALLDFLNVTDADKAPALKKSLLPEIEYKGRKYVGPADELTNMCYLQFAAADSLATGFTVTKDVELLNSLFATLYSDKKFNKEQDEYMIPIAKQIPNYVKIAALFNFICLKSNLPNKYPYAFGAGGTKDKTGKQTVPNYQSMKVRLAGQKFGTPENVEATDIHDVFTLINDNEKDNQED